jgi:3-oxoacyl-[acyl-carrier-protein] synthase II
MGAAGALELAGNLSAFDDRACHPTINLERRDPECRLEGLIVGETRELPAVNYILNNSFGMLGINSVLIVKRV